NCFVMKRNAAALSRVLGAPVELQGYTDLTLHGKKFSGNAQRRKQKYLLFHGTFLLNFDLPLIERVLRLPPKQPEYRAARSHLDFLTNLSAAADAIKETLCKEWSATEVLRSAPRERMSRLISEKYSRDTWNL